jgi:CheY-like chemotaxis protein
MRSSTLNVLLVEDDEVDVMNVQRAFRKHCISHFLHIARDGLEALEMLRGSLDKPPVVPSTRRLILLDLNMPRMNGIKFLEALRADLNLRQIPVVVLTTSDEDRDLIQAYNFNVAGYILKPFAFGSFVDLMMVLNSYWALSEIP